MRAVVITRHGGPEVLEVREVPDPVPGVGQVRVRVAGAGLNRADLLQRAGRYPAPPGVPSDIPGLEYSGTVESVGPGVVRARVGDRVMGIVAGGACAELLVVHEGELVPAPEGVDQVRCAAIPEAFMTAWDGAHLQGGLGVGQALLVSAVGSGVGTAAVQLARAAGARAIGTARSAWKLERAQELGLDAGVLADGDLRPALRASGASDGVDVVLDLVGGPALAPLLGHVRLQGTIVCVGLVGGARVELPLAVLLARRLRLVGTVLRSRPLEQKIALARSFTDRVAPLFASGALRPIVDEVLPLRDVAHAHARLEAGDVFGKLVLGL